MFSCCQRDADPVLEHVLQLPAFAYRVLCAVFLHRSESCAWSSRSRAEASDVLVGQVLNVVPGEL